MERQVRSIYERGEVDLVGLAQILWEQKWVILLGTAFSLLIGLMYLYLAKPTYEIQVRVAPPRAVACDVLNLTQFYFIDTEAKFSLFTTPMIYDSFVRVLLADSTKQSFFNIFYSPKSQSSNALNKQTSSDYHQFERSLIIKENLRSNPAEYTITFNAASANKLLPQVEQYLQFANKKALEQIVQDIALKKEKFLANLETKIALKKEQEKLQRLYRLTQLQEALNIAEAAGLSEPGGGGYIITVVGALNDPSIMYGRGSKALNAEIKNLNNRDSHDEISSQIIYLESQYKMYKKYEVHIDDLRMFSIVSISEVINTIEHKRNKVLVFSLFLGLICGTAFGLLRHFLTMKASNN